MTIIQIALLSRWHVHADDYAREAKDNKALNIQMVWDEDTARGEQWARELGVPFEADLDCVCANPSIDAVIVTTPTHRHKEILIKAAKHKKHIFTEKVLALTVKDCEAILEAVKEQGVEVMLSLPRLVEKEFLYAEKALEQGWLGKLSMIRCRLAHNGGVIYEGEDRGWLPERFFRKEQTGGGALIDLGAHPIYLMNRLAGKAEALYARLQQQESDQVDDTAVVTVEYTSGALGVIETSFLSHGSPFQLELYGTEGTLLAEEGEVKIKSMHVNENNWTLMDEPMTDKPRPLEQWLQAIKEQKQPSITKDDFIKLTLINEASVRSHQEGRRIIINKMLTK
nr:Gfo/Idh/MocA family oxidoreductase [Priestia megaterium]